MADTLTLELTPLELLALAAGVKSVLACTIAGGNPTPGNIIEHELYHKVAHEALADVESLRGLFDKLDVALAAAYPESTALIPETHQKVAQMRAVAEARARNANPNPNPNLPEIH